MNKPKVMIITLFILIAGMLFPLGMPRATAIEQTTQDDIFQRGMKYYRVETWPKLSLPLVRGLDLADLKLEGFQLKEKGFFGPARGIDYTWYDPRQQVQVRVIVKVCASVETAHQQLLEWLVTGNSSLLKKGKLTGPGVVVGDISWADPSYNILAFARRNVVVILLGESHQAAHRSIIDNIAGEVDRMIDKDVRLLRVSPKAAAAAAPMIETITLDKPEPNVNDTVKIDVTAWDPGGGKLEYQYYATGGNILRTREGTFYQALIPGTHQITVMVINPGNMMAEKTIPVKVIHEQKERK